MRVPRTTPLFLALASVLALPCAASAADRRDYGDAPDGRPAGYETSLGAPGNFPSTRASVGPSHRSGRLRIGDGWTGERDSRQVDRDRGDSGAGLERLRACKRSTLLVAVNARKLPDRFFKRKSKAKIYVNAWFDWNRDGDFADGTDGCAPEWGVQDLALSPRELGEDRVALLPIRFRTGRSVEEFWWRATVTLGEKARDPAARGINARGSPAPYRFGETEDRLQPPALEPGARTTVFSHFRPPVALAAGETDFLTATKLTYGCYEEFILHGKQGGLLTGLEGGVRASREGLRASYEDTVVIKAPRDTKSYVIKEEEVSRRLLLTIVSLSEDKRGNPIEEVPLRLEVRGRLVVRRGSEIERSERLTASLDCVAIIFHGIANEVYDAKQRRRNGGDQPSAPPPRPDAPFTAAAKLTPTGNPNEFDAEITTNKAIGDNTEVTANSDASFSFTNGFSISNCQEATGSASFIRCLRAKLDVLRMIFRFVLSKGAASGEEVGTATVKGPDGAEVKIPLRRP